MKFTSLAKYALVTAATIIGLNMMTASKAEAQTVCKVDCVRLRAEYDKLAAKYGVNNKLVKLAKAYLDKVCPPAPVETRIYECLVADKFGTATVSLGLDASSNLTNITASTSKIVCSTQAACSNIASLKFVVNGTLASSRCAANSVDPSISRLSDADMQTKINQLP